MWSMDNSMPPKVIRRRRSFDVSVRRTSAFGDPGMNLEIHREMFCLSFLLLMPGGHWQPRAALAP
jgi:hypothetical protein